MTFKNFWGHPATGEYSVGWRGVGANNPPPPPVYAVRARLKRKYCRSEAQVHANAITLHQAS